LGTDVLHIQPHRLCHPGLNLIAGEEGGAQLQGNIPDHSIDLSTTGELDLIQVRPDSYILQFDLAGFGKLGELSQLLQSLQADLSAVVGLGFQLRHHSLGHYNSPALELSRLDPGRDSAIYYHAGIWH